MTEVGLVVVPDALQWRVAMKKLAFVLVALAVALVAGLLWGVLRVGPSPPPASAPGSSLEEPAPPPSAASAAAPAPDRARVELAAPAVEESESLPVFPAERVRGGLVGEVVDVREQPLAGVVVEARPFLTNLPPNLLIADDRRIARRIETDADGRFRLTDLQAGPTLLAAHDEDLGSDQAVVFVGPDSDRHPSRLQLDPRSRFRDELRVTVLDREQEPVAGAIVEVFGWRLLDVRTRHVERTATQPLARATTAADGVAVLRDLGMQGGVVFAHDDAGRTGWVAQRKDMVAANVMTITLAPSGSVQGELHGVPAAEVEGATVTLLASWSTNPYYTAGGRRLDAPVHDGRFRLAAVPAGTYGIALRAPHAVRLVLQPFRWGEQELANSVASKTVTVESAEAVTVDLAVTHGGRIEGRVTSQGEPVQGARVRAVLAPPTANFTDGFVLHGVHVWRLETPYDNGPQSPLTHVSARTDRDGRYVLEGLQPGRHRLEVTADRLSFDRREDVVVRDGETAHEEHELLPAGVLQVAVLGASYLGVTPVGAAQPVAIATTRDDCVTFPGLAAGRYVVARFHSDASVAPVPVGTGEVVAGRTTWLDLRAASVRAVLRGRVTSNAQPVAGATVVVYPTEAVTDAQGTFRLELGYPVWFRGGFGASLHVRRGGIDYEYTPDVGDPVTDADFAIELGARTVEVVAVDERGAAVPVTATFSLEVAEASSSRVRKLSGTMSLPVAGSLGPMPAGTLRGVATFADGYQVPFEADLTTAATLRITRPSTAILHVRVLAAGQPLPGVGVYASTWDGDGPAPDDASAFGMHATGVQHAAAGEDGVATLRVLPGDVLVTVTRGFMAQGSRRLHVDAGAEAQVDVDVP